MLPLRFTRRLFLPAMVVCLGLTADGQAAVPQSIQARVDALLAKHWQAIGVVPTAACDDADFLRRAWLDLAGTVPPAREAIAFLDDATPNKREKLVDRLLAGDEFAEQWGGILTEVLTDQRPVLRPTHNGRVLRRYLSEALASDRPYTELVRELIAGAGVNDSSGPANFVLCYEADPVKLTGAVTRRFLGVTLECAQCHDHPFDQYTRDDFWGVAACFARTKKLSDPNGEILAVVDARRGELEIDAPPPVANADQASSPTEVDEADAEPPPKRIVAPRLPDGRSLDASASRRAELASWVAGESNRDFARHTVDIVWKRLFSSTLTESGAGGDAGATALRQELLDLIAGELTAQGFHFKPLLRAIVLSRAYAAPGESSPDETAESRHRRLQCFARFAVRPLSADELFRSIGQATGYEGGYEELELETGEIEDNPYADPPIELLSERPLTVQRSLALLNGDFVREAAQFGARASRAAAGKNLSRRIEHVYLATLSRRPSGDEMRSSLGLVQAAAKPQQGLEDLVWMLLNSAEFNTNH